MRRDKSEAIRVIMQNNSMKEGKKEAKKVYRLYFE